MDFARLLMRIDGMHCNISWISRSFWWYFTVSSNFTSRQPRNKTKANRKTTKPLISIAKSRPTKTPQLSNTPQRPSKRSTQSRKTKVSLLTRTSTTTAVRGTFDRRSSRSTRSSLVRPSVVPGDRATVAKSSHGVDAARGVNATLYPDGLMFGGIKGKETLLFRIGLGLTLVIFAAAVCTLVSWAEGTKPHFISS